MCSAHIHIGKQLVDEAMRLVSSYGALGSSDVRVCKCAMSAAIQRVINDFKQGRLAGMVRFDFLVDGRQRSVLINAGYIIQSYKLSHVQA